MSLARLFRLGLALLLGGLAPMSAVAQTQPTPFFVEGETPISAFWIGSDQRVGLGTAAPEAALHVFRAGGGASLVVEDRDPRPASRELIRLANTGGSYVTLQNTASGASWYVTHEHRPDGRFILSHSDGGMQFGLSRTGDLQIMGQLMTAGACAAGCDRVFDEDYPLPTIAEQAALMKANRHLPNVGPTPEDGPFNLTAMTGGMLNELEKAHLYIGQLHETLAAQQQANAAQEVAIAALTARLEALEAQAKAD